MTEPQPPGDDAGESDWSPWTQAWGCWVALAFAVLFAVLTTPLGDLLVTPLYLAFCLLFGWVRFVLRTVPNVEFHLGTAVVAAVSVGLLAYLWHNLASWFRRAKDEATPWKPGWTFATTGLVLLAFVAGTAVVGIVHQVGWMLTDDEPIWRDLNSRWSPRMASKNNLKQVGLAFHIYHDTYGELPRGIVLDASGRPMHSWATSLLPMLEQRAVHKRIDFDQPWDAPANAEPMGVRIPTLWNPGLDAPAIDERGYGTAHYAGNVRLFDSRPARRFRDVTDGLSNTIISGEVSENVAAWGDPLNVRDPALGLGRSPTTFGGPWRDGGTKFLMCDGQVRHLSPDVDPDVLRALATPDGYEVVELP